MIFGAIVAGGIGSRMNISDMPKQFMLLDDKPIIMHTLEKFMLCQRLDYIFIGVHKDWTCYMEDLLKKYKINTDRVFVVKGGQVRNLTIMNIIAEIEKKYGESDEHIIVTHDAVRPFITLRSINENIDVAMMHGACDTVAPAFDTIVVSEDGIEISEIPDRSKLYLGQTPQSFNMLKLKNLYNSLKESEKAILTDACKIFIFRNQPVKLVKGDSSNIKITTVSDYKLAQAMIGAGVID